MADVVLSHVPVFIYRPMFQRLPSPAPAKHRRDSDLPQSPKKERAMSVQEQTMHPDDRLCASVSSTSTISSKQEHLENSMCVSGTGPGSGEGRKNALVKGMHHDEVSVCVFRFDLHIRSPPLLPQKVFEDPVGTTRDASNACTCMQKCSAIPAFSGAVLFMPCGSPQVCGQKNKKC